MSTEHIYQIAIERLAALLEEKRELESFIATYQRLQNAAVAGSVAKAATVSPTLSYAMDVEVAPPSRARGTTEEVVTAAMQVLADNRGPMRLGDLYSAVVSRGIKVGGKIPKNNLGAKLSADPRLRTVAGQGWWFADEPLPDEGEPYPMIEYEKGPEAIAAEPSHLNGATGLTTY